MTIQSPLVYELYNLASSERDLHHCAAGTHWALTGPGGTSETNRDPPGGITGGLSVLSVPGRRCASAWGGGQPSFNKAGAGGGGGVVRGCRPPAPPPAPVMDGWNAAAQMMARMTRRRGWSPRTTPHGTAAHRHTVCAGPECEAPRARRTEPGRAGRVTVNYR